MTNQEDPFGCLGFILSLFTPVVEAEIVTETPSFPFVATDVLTPTEKAFFKTLTATLRGRLLIFTKVRMEDIVGVNKNIGLERRELQRQRNRVKSRHFDFVLCTPEGVKTILVIELDDRSHSSPSVRATDQFKNDVLKAVGIPILRIPVARNYDPLDLFNRIEAAVTT